MSWMGVIFYVSHQPGDVSGDLSGSFIQTIETLLRVDLSNYHTLIRKGAHFSVYLILGMFMYETLVSHDMYPKNPGGLALFFSMLYAISDEIHQLYIPGRSGEVGDVIIDTFGAFVGIMMMWTIKKRFIQYHKI